jgi:hypothetical protein
MRELTYAFAQLCGNIERLQKFQISLNGPDIFARTGRRNDDQVPSPIPTFSAPDINLTIVMRVFLFLAIWGAR